MNSFPHPTIWRTPEELPGGKILAIAPHPDDETIGFGGSLALHAQQGDAVKIVIATDGRMGDHLGKFDPQLYTKLREQECKRAASILGISDVEFWRNPDGSLSQSENFIPSLIQLLDDFQPDVIYFPSPFEFHSDHLAVTEGIVQAVSKAKLNPTLLMGELVELMMYNLLVAVDSVYQQKQDALKCYTSQLQYVDIDVVNEEVNHVRTANFVHDKKYVEAFIKTDKKKIKKIIHKVYSLRRFLLK